MNPVDPTVIAMVAAKAALAALVYALPAILAGWWRQPRPEQIALLNLLLGWTGIGWLALLLYVVRRRVRTRSAGRRTTPLRPTTTIHSNARRRDDLSAMRPS